MDSYFEKGVKLKGTLWVKGNVHFDADIEGMVYSNDHFIIGPLGHLEGDVYSYDFSNIGKLNGNVFADHKVSLMQGSKLVGDIAS
jgi:cytoskeletal protein CcmA (bactofilin family)